MKQIFTSVLFGFLIFGVFCFLTKHREWAQIRNVESIEQRIKLSDKALKKRIADSPRVVPYRGWQLMGL